MTRISRVTDTFYFASLLERWNFDSSLIRIIYKNIWNNPENQLKISKNQRFFINIKISQKPFAPFQIPLSENLQRIIIKKKHISKNRLFLSYQYEYERDKYFQKFLSPLARRQILITPLILDRLQFQSSDNGRAKSRHSTPACSTTPYINRAGLSAARVTRSP